MTCRVDLHIHTVFSGDSTITPKLVVNQLHRHSLVEGVAITDHNTLEGYLRVAKLASVYQDLVIVPGIEITTEKGDLIVLGVQEKPTRPLTLDSVIDFARRTDGVIVIPHPYRSMGIGDLAVDVDADAVEVLNPTATHRENMLALRLARTRNLAEVAGTDAHEPSEMWKVFTEVEAQPNVESVLDAIRNGFTKALTGRAAN